MLPAKETGQLIQRHATSRRDVFACGVLSTMARKLARRNDCGRLRTNIASSRSLAPMMLSAQDRELLERWTRQQTTRTPSRRGRASCSRVRLVDSNARIAARLQLTLHTMANGAGGMSRGLRVFWLNRGPGTPRSVSDAQVDRHHVHVRHAGRGCDALEHARHGAAGGPESKHGEPDLARLCA